MEKQRVIELLAELHTELTSAGELDEATADKLREAAIEIEAVVAGAHSSTSQSLAQRLHDAVQHLTDSHPAVSTAVGRIADALAQIGI